MIWLTLVCLVVALQAHADAVTLLNVSYDVTREFYKDFNAAFAADWKGRTGQRVTVNQSHGGSSKQARSVIDGLEADVVTMNQALEFLYTEAGQELAAKHNFRPQNPAVLARHGAQFKPIQLFTVNEVAGGWQKAQQVHFADGRAFDQLYQPRK